MKNERKKSRRRSGRRREIDTDGKEMHTAERNEHGEQINSKENNYAINMVT